MEELASTQHVQHQHSEPHTLIPTPMNSASSAGASPFPPISPAASRTAYMTQQSSPLPQHPLPLGSPAAGTLPPVSASMGQNSGSSSSATMSAQKQAIDYKPYKPKFHNASLYATPKEAAAAAAAAAAASGTNTMTATVPTVATARELMTPPQQQPIPSPQQKLADPSSVHSATQSLSHQQHQQLLIEAQKLATAHNSSPHAAVVHLPPQPSPSHVTTTPHHPSLSPSTQMKLNNHISSHQLQQLQQQQQQQLHQLQAQAAAVAAPPHHLLGPPPQGTTLPLPLAAAAYYLGQPPPGSPAAALLHPSAHIGSQAFYNPMAAAVAQQQAFASFNLMTPQQQQQFHHQLQMQQQHLHQLQHSAAAAAAAAAITQPPPPQQQQAPTQTHAPQQPQPVAPPSPAQNHIKAPTPVMVGSNIRQSPATASSAASMHHTKANTTLTTSSGGVHVNAQQNPLQYLANAASVATAMNTQLPMTNNKGTMEGVVVLEQQQQQQPQQLQQVTVVGGNQRQTTNLLQTSNNAGIGEGTLVCNCRIFHNDLSKTFYSLSLAKKIYNHFYD